MNMNNKTDVYVDNEKAKSRSSSDTNTIITTFLDPINPPSLTPSQRAQLDALSNLSDDTVRKEAEADPDCKPL